MTTLIRNRFRKNINFPLWKKKTKRFTFYEALLYDGLNDGLSSRPSNQKSIVEKNMLVMLIEYTSWDASQTKYGAICFWPRNLKRGGVILEVQRLVQYLIK